MKEGFEKLSHSSISPQKLSQDRTTDNEFNQDKISDRKLDYSGITGSEFNQGRTSDRKLNYSGITDNKLNQSRISEHKLNYNGTTDNEFNQDRTSDRKLNYSGITDSEFIQSRTIADELNNDRITDSQFNQSRTIVGELNNSRIAENEFNQNSKTTDKLNYNRTSGHNFADTELSCNVIKDLLPSYVEGICSEDSRKIIEQHLLSCADCAALTEALRESETTVRQREAKQIAYLKKIKKHAGIKELIGLGILLVTIGFSLRIFAEHYGAVSWLYFIALPLVLIDTHFLLLDHTARNQRTEPKIVMEIIGSLLLCAALFIAFISMQWVLQNHYPSGLAAASLGKFLKTAYIILALGEFVIFAAGVALTLKNANSHSIVISISMTGLFLVFYIFSCFAFLTSVEHHTKMLGQSLYLLLEGGFIGAVAAWIEKRKLREH